MININRLSILLFALLFWPALLFSQSAELAGESGDSGFYNRTGSDILFSTDHATARFYTINGYRFNPHVSAGLGIGYVPYNDPFGLIPIFTDLTVTVLDSDVSPFFYFRFGYSRTIHEGPEDSGTEIDQHYGGLMINPGVGLQLRTSNNWGIYLNAGYNRDRSTHEFPSWGGRTVKNTHTYQRINLGIGLFF